MITHLRRLALGACLVLAIVTAGATQAVAAPAAVGSFGPLTGLAIDRIEVGDQVAASKFGTGTPIDDPVREAQVLAQVRQQATAAGIDEQAAVAFFQDQITASKVVQRGLFRRWTAHPAEAPTVKPDLTQIRAQLDRLTTEILAQLVATDRQRHHNPLCGAEVTAAGVSGAVLNHLDALHRKALTVALGSVCVRG